MTKIYTPQDEERRLKVQQGQEKKGAVGKKEDLMRATQAISRPCSREPALSIRTRHHTTVVLLPFEKTNP